MEDVALNMRAPYFYPTSTRFHTLDSRSGKFWSVSVPGTVLPDESEIGWFHVAVMGCR